MPLGASITYGQRSSTGNGYREDLYNLLTQEGYTVRMAGSRKHGSMADNEVEGWPGFRIDQVERKAKRAVPGRLPNLFTINVGTNDCIQDYNLDHARNRMDDLLEYLWTASPNSTVILSTLLVNVNATVESRIQRVNRRFKALAMRKTQEGKRIILADMHGDDGPQKADLSADGIHPNDRGYAKMANIWNRSIREASREGMIVEPRPLPEA